MANLREYIEQMRTKHEIRIKLACPLSDELNDKIEKHLEKYDAEKITAPHKLILQKRPLDFPNLESAEVNIIDFTAGLPVVRTSPDHGTGYDIAGKNMASANSFREALFTAINIVKRRKESAELISNPLKLSKFSKDRD